MDQAAPHGQLGERSWWDRLLRQHVFWLARVSAWYWRKTFSFPGHGDARAYYVDVANNTAGHVSNLPPCPDSHLRVVCVSDTHTYHDHFDIPQGDIFIHAGDLTFMNKNFQSTIVKFNSFLGRLPHTLKFVVPGNHDRGAQEDEEETRKLMSNAVLAPNHGITHENITIWGNAFSNPSAGSSNRAFTDTSQRESLQDIPDGTDVLVSHSGSGVDIHRAVTRIKPMFHVHGHFHGAHGARFIQWPDGRTTVSINCAVLDGRYHPVFLPVVFDIKRPTASSS